MKEAVLREMLSKVLNGWRQRARRVFSKKLQLRLDIHQAKDSRLYYHLHDSDDKIIATSRFYNCLQDMRVDVETLLAGKASISYVS